MPQPIDLQTEIGRISIADRIQQISDRASLLGQQRAAVAEQKEHVAAETQVAETKEAHGEGVDADGKRRNPFVMRKHHGHDGEEDSGCDEGHDDQNDDSDEHCLDVSV